jgi:hypothetical protein
MNSGYSSKTLEEKLGVKDNIKILIIKSLDNISHFPENQDIIHFYTKQRKELENIFPKLRSSIKQNGAVWISWPKKSSKTVSNLDENIIREVGLSSGMVDVKVIAVDDIWSGLKFVIRTKDRI